MIDHILAWSKMGGLENIFGVGRDQTNYINVSSNLLTSQELQNFLSLYAIFHPEIQNVL